MNPFLIEFTLHLSFWSTLALTVSLVQENGFAFTMHFVENTVKASVQLASWI